MLLRLLLAAALLLGQFGNAWARPYPYQWNPPARYDHAFKGKRIIVPVTASGIWCGLAYGCTYVGGEKPGQCTSWILAYKHRLFRWSQPVNKSGWYALIRHETGHCNGWPANHPR
jgi:hypothetical protein